MKRSRSVRAYIIALVVAVTLPLLVFGAFLLTSAVQNEQQAIATMARERAQGAAADLDRELKNLQDLISFLAMSQNFAVGNAATFNTTRLLNGGDLGLVVRDLSGQPLLNTCVLDGRMPPLSRAVGEVLYNVNHGRAVISDLATEPSSGEPFLTIDLPVWREDNSAYLISLCALPRILQVLREQHLPNGWTAMVIDRQQRTIASVTESAGLSLIAAGHDPLAIARADKGWVLNPWRDPDPGYQASSYVELAGWVVAIDVPGETFYGPVRRALLLLVGGGGTLAVVFVLAVNIGRRIAGPIANLTGIAMAVQSGGQLAPALTGISEADLVALTLCSTSMDLRQRTAELTQTTGALQHSEERLKTLSDDLRHALDERRRLVNRLVSAQENERQRVARELHDHLGQYAAAMLFRLKTADQASNWHDEWHENLGELKTMALAMSQEIHRLSWELRPAALDELGLEVAIANYVETWSGRFNLVVDFVANLRGRRLSAPVEIVLYRVLQEAVTNVAKHAQAEKISVVLEAKPSEVSMIVEDNGIGIGDTNVSFPAGPASGFGLVGIRERLALVGGSLVIESAPNCGTTLCCRIPA